MIYLLTEVKDGIENRIGIVISDTTVQAAVSKLGREINFQSSKTDGPTVYHLKNKSNSEPEYILEEMVSIDTPQEFVQRSKLLKKKAVS